MKVNAAGCFEHMAGAAIKKQDRKKRNEQAFDKRLQESLQHNSLEGTSKDTFEKKFDPEGYHIDRAEYSYQYGKKATLAENELLSEENDKTAGSKEEESKTHSDIVVNADGSRVLVITMKFGGAETQMSIELSKPTEMDNDIQKHDGMPAEKDIMPISTNAVDTSN